ncbi:HAD-IC family P-type ATPase [Nocardioides sp. W7]|uniref:heavy metal translocating P-type ATPase n=1 Tax=Nocardioides sp. W7 TaxID=2931390 RepID=UPI0024684E5D|nr:HAD-IC family P-type ATPase [Nocardioides sp. W7]
MTTTTEPVTGVRLVARSEAAGRARHFAPGLVGSTARAVQVEDAVAQVHGVRAVHAYPRTGALVVWFRPGASDHGVVTEAVTAGLCTSSVVVPSRRPRSEDVSNGDLARMSVGGAALVLLGIRRYVARRPPVLGPTARTAAAGVTLFTGYPFLRGALRGLAGLATPTAISAAIGNGARRGILVKGGSHLEAAARVDAVVFDKTGTLTVGRPVVTNVVSFSDDWTPEQVLTYAASSEIHSRHPLAQAVIRSTEDRHIAIPAHEECEVLLGLGMRTFTDGRVLLLGNLDLLDQEKVSVPDDATARVTRLQRDTETPLLLAVDGTLTGLISLRDTVRPESRAVVAALRADGVRRVVMLTGDHPHVARAVADELGIDEWHAQVLPEGKQDVVRTLQAEGHVVAMVGDDLCRLLDLSREAVRVIRQNYGMSIAVNAIGLGVGATGALSPVVAALLHNASSIAVVGNSARITRYRVEQDPPPGMVPAGQVRPEDGASTGG